MFDQSLNPYRFAEGDARRKRGKKKRGGTCATSDQPRLAPDQFYTIDGLSSSRVRRQRGRKHWRVVWTFFIISGHTAFVGKEREERGKEEGAFRFAILPADPVQNDPPKKGERGGEGKSGKKKKRGSGYSAVFKLAKLIYFTFSLSEGPGGREGGGEGAEGNYGVRSCDDKSVGCWRNCVTKKKERKGGLPSFIAVWVL